MDHLGESKGERPQKEVLRRWRSSLSIPPLPFTLTGPALGMVCMLLATACFAIMNALIRYLGKGGFVPPPEIAFFRSFLGLLILLPFIGWLGWRSIKTERIGLHALRGGIQGISMMLFFVGLSLTPLAKTTAFEFAAPILATTLAILFLAEPVHWRRILAMAIGLVGILIVLRPGFIPLDWGPICVIASVILWAGCQLMIRTLSKTETSVTQTFYMALFLIPVTGLTSVFVWVWPTLPQLGIMLIVAAVANVGTVLYGEAFRRAEMSAVLPLESTKILWTASIGWAFFAEQPDVWTIAGGLIIFSAAAYITIREAQIARAAR